MFNKINYSRKKTLIEKLICFFNNKNNNHKYYYSYIKLGISFYLDGYFILNNKFPCENKYYDENRDDYTFMRTVLIKLNKGLKDHEKNSI